MRAAGRAWRLLVVALLLLVGGDGVMVATGWMRGLCTLGWVMGVVVQAVRTEAGVTKAVTCQTDTKATRPTRAYLLNNVFIILVAGSLGKMRKTEVRVSAI